MNNQSDPHSSPPCVALIEAIHASDYQAVIAVTGGGSSAVSQLLTVAGASRTILEVRIPYAQAALEDWLAGWSGQACSGPAARVMAMAAWERARQLAPNVNPQRLVGLACTASLATDRPKRGSHRIHVAAQTASHTSLISLTLSKGARNRNQEEYVAASMLLSMLARVCEVKSAPSFSAVQEMLKGDEQLDATRQTAPSAWTELLLGQRQWVWDAGGRNGANDNQACLTDMDHSSPSAIPTIFFPGAFNPPHAGHLQMARLATVRLQRPVIWELSIRNVDKPTLDFVEITKRLAKLQALIGPGCGASGTGQKTGICQGIVLTTAPTFLDKARLFPDSLFIVGADTITRIGELRYYHQDPRQRDRAIAELASLGCRFLVFGRLYLSGSKGQIKETPDSHTAENRQVPFHTLRELQLPDRLLALCEEVTADEFRMDLRSRDLRS